MIRTPATPYWIAVCNKCGERADIDMVDCGHIRESGYQDLEVIPKQVLIRELEYWQNFFHQLVVQAEGREDVTTPDIGFASALLVQRVKDLQPREE